MTRRLILCFGLILCGQVWVVAQGPSGVCDCPIIEVSCPTDVYDLGQKVTISANLSTSDPRPVYRWKISSEKIISGQGTSTINVKVTKDGATTATVKVVGDAMPPDCNRTVSCTFGFYLEPSTRKYGEFGPVSVIEEKAQLLKFAAALKKDRNARGYVIAYGKPGYDRAELGRHLARISDYLTGHRIAAPRIVTTDGGSRENPGVELWIVQAGAHPPAVMPGK